MCPPWPGGAQGGRSTLGPTLVEIGITTAAYLIIQTETLDGIFTSAGYIDGATARSVEVNRCGGPGGAQLSCEGRVQGLTCLVRPPPATHPGVGPPKGFFSSDFLHVRQFVHFGFFSGEVFV